MAQSHTTFTGQHGETERSPTASWDSPVNNPSLYPRPLICPPILNLFHPTHHDGTPLPKWFQSLNLLMHWELLLRPPQPILPPLKPNTSVGAPLSRHSGLFPSVQGTMAQISPISGDLPGLLYRINPLPFDILIQLPNVGCLDEPISVGPAGMISQFLRDHLNEHTLGKLSKGRQYLQ